MITQTCDQDHRKRDQYLPELLLAINTARQDSTGYTPAFLNLRRIGSINSYLAYPFTAWTGRVS